MGNEKTLLIDTGWGTVDLKSIVCSMSTLPLIVANSHGHIDHINGNFQFEGIYIRDEELEIVKKNLSFDKRSKILSKFSKDQLAISENEWLQLNKCSTISLNDIKTIELGNTNIEIVHTPGHTAGSVCFYQRNQNILFCGDTILEGNIFLHLKESSSIGEYLESLKKIISMIDEKTVIFPSHAPLPLRNAIVSELIGAVEKIINRQVNASRQVVLGVECNVTPFENFIVYY
jgi:glyoxylase-like metal-dependent hydrolase (beta-lactamase superfamily II)